MSAVVISPYSYGGGGGGGGSSNVTYVGTLGNTSNGASGATLAYTVPSTVPVGGYVIICAGNKGGGATPTCADNRSNTYTRIVAEDDGTRCIAIFIAPVTTQLVSTDTITVTFTNTGTGRFIVAFQAAGTYTIEHHGSTQGTTATPAVNVTNAAGFTVGCVMHNNSSTTYTPPSGWTEDLDVNGIGVSVTSDHLIASANGTVTYNPVASASSAMVIAGASFN